MQRNNWIVLGIIAFLLIGLIAIANNSSSNRGENSTTTPIGINPGENIEIPNTSQVITVDYGNTTLALNQVALLPEGSLKFISVDEDSRCPQGVQCIQAGTVKTTVEYTENGDTKRTSLELNKSFNRDGERITLTNVLPVKVEGSQISPGSYRFVINVVDISEIGDDNGSSNSGSGDSQASGGCFVGGCSGQICSDEPGAISTCEFREEYACYKPARCERQANGQCGWTATSQLQACLANAR